jgi:predicted DNA-binding protein
MEVAMELTKKTTILFPPELHDRLSRLAAERGSSLGGLVREACERAYGASTTEERLAAVQSLAALQLPVGSPEELARESVPSPEDLLP